MIARSQGKIEPVSWQVSLREAWTDPLALLCHLGVNPAAAGFDPAAAEGFAFRVPRPYAALIAPGDPTDPLLRQVLPVAAERARIEGFVADPVGDRAAEREPGLLQKYSGRALLLVTGACAIHCRYCFRREFPYHDSVGTRRLEVACAAIAADPDIDEVILSGGDPLLLADDRLAALAGQLAAIPHLRRLRIHTRLPVTLPDRLTADFLRWFAGSHLEPVLVLHLNHPRETSPALMEALMPLRRAGVTLLNQAVLLRGVNDDTETLVALSRKLHAAGILPYYLHVLDRVQGAAHFEVDDQRASALAAELRARLPGYLVPRLVREVPGAPSKTPLL